MWRAYKRIAVGLFGPLADRSIASFAPLKVHVRNANLGILFRTWIAVIFLTTALVYLASVGVILLLQALLRWDAVIFLYYLVLIPVMTAALTFLLFYVYPLQKSKSMNKSIEANLPFALSHMSSIASSGIPPEIMFELIAKFNEYGEVSRQAKTIVRNMKTFGMSSTNAIRDVSKRTSSMSFRQILNGIDATIERGGSLNKYLAKMAETAFIDYRLKREKYLRTLSIYADVYTALLVAAPLMMLAVLGVISIIGGTVFGFTVRELILVTTLVIIPIMNVIFLAFLYATYPGI